MPIRLSALANDRRTVVVLFDSGELKVTYRPSAMNDKNADAGRRLSEDGQSTRSEATILASWLLDWDLEDDNGAILPITAATLVELGMAYITRISSAIIDDAFPNRNRGRR